MAGALSAIPVLCMGIFAPLAPLLARRLGARWALAACALLVIGFGLLRLGVPGPVLVLALTFGVGLGMGLAGPIFPLVVRHEMPARPALGTGAYAIGLVLGSTIAAAVAVPLAGAGGDWRFALAVITLAGLGPLAVWLGLAPPDEVADETIAPPRIPWRSPIGWVLGLLFGLQSMLYYGVVTWLAAVYVERGWSEPDCGQPVALFGAVTLVGTAVMPLGADRIGTRRGQLVASSIAHPHRPRRGRRRCPVRPSLWAVVLGAGMGTIFPIVLTLPVDVGGRPADVAATAALMLLVGYLLSAIAPLAFGIARDLTGDFGSEPGGSLVGLGVVLVALSAALTPERLHRARSARPADPTSMDRKAAMRADSAAMARLSPPGAGSPRSAPPSRPPARPARRSSPAAGKRYDGPWRWTRRHDLAGRVGDRRRDRRDALVELLERPRVAVAPDRAHPLEQARRRSTSVRAVNALHRPAEVALDEGRRRVARAAPARTTRRAAGCATRSSRGPRPGSGCRPGRCSGPGRRRARSARPPRRPRRPAPRATGGRAPASERAGRIRAASVTSRGPSR